MVSSSSVVGSRACDKKGFGGDHSLAFGVVSGRGYNLGPWPGSHILGREPVGIFCAAALHAVGTQRRDTGKRDSPKAFARGLHPTHHCSQGRRRLFSLAMRAVRASHTTFFDQLCKSVRSVANCKF